MTKDIDSSTRGVVLNMMKTQGALTVGEMAKQLGITEMAVRRHLQSLERDGLVQSSLSRQAMGRPTHLYALTAKADDLFPKNYHHLTLDLLGELAAEEGDEMVTTLFKRRQEKLQHKYADRMQGKSLDERVQTLADIQNESGYMVQLSTDEKGRYVLEEYNCPIAQVAKKYNDACHCELGLFGQLLDAPVERTECLTKGGAKCTYVIGGTAKR